MSGLSKRTDTRMSYPRFSIGSCLVQPEQLLEADLRGCQCVRRHAMHTLLSPVCAIARVDLRGCRRCAWPPARLAPARPPCTSCCSITRAQRVHKGTACRWELLRQRLQQATNHTSRRQMQTTEKQVAFSRRQSVFRTAASVCSREQDG